MRWLSDSVKDAAMANMATQIVGMVGQLVFIPIFIKAWGGDLYGVWMICVGITAYAAVLDFGVSQAGANEVIAALMRGDKENATFWSSLSFRVAIGMAVLVLIIAGFFWNYGIDFISTGLGARGFAVGVYVCISVQLALLVVFNMYICLIRAAGANATASWIALVAISGEIALPPAIALFGGSLSDAAIGLVAPRLVGLVIAAFTLNYAAPWSLKAGKQTNYLSRVKEILMPSVANLLLPGGMAVFLQASLAVIGGVFGAQAAAVVGVSRTLSRLPFQLSYVLTRAELPNLTRMIALKDRSNFDTVFIRLVKVFVFCTLPMLLAYATFGKFFLEVWTGNGLPFDATIILLLAVACAIHAAWNLLVAPLMASNKHGLFSIVFFCFSCASVFLMKFTGSLNVALGLIVLSELFVCVFALVQLKLKIYSRFNN